MNLNWIRKRENLDRNTKYLNIIITSLVIIGTLLLTYTFYRDKIFHDEVKGYFIYYCFSVCFILFWLIIFFLNNNIRINTILSTISLTVGLLLLETILYALGYSDMTKLLHKSVSNYDTRTGLEVINDFKKDGIDAVPNLSPTIALSYASKDLVPMGGISKKTVVATNESGKYMVYKSDRYGFNNPDFEWENKTVDWLLVGDSYTQGLAVQTGEDIGGQIRKLLKQSVLNLGMAGNTPLIELGAIKEYAYLKKPKKVLWIYYEGNDLLPSESAKSKHKTLIQYLNINFTQNLIKRQNEIDLYYTSLMNKAIIETENNTYSIISFMKLQILRRMLTTVYHGMSGNSIVIDPSFAKILLQAKKDVNSWGGEIYFVYLPEFSRYKYNVSHNSYNKKQEVIDLVKKLDIQVIDIHKEVFLKYKYPLELFPFERHNHYNAKGYKLVTKAIINSID